MRFLVTPLFTLTLATLAILAECMPQKPFLSRLNNEAIVVNRSILNTADVPFKSHNVGASILSLPQLFLPSFILIVYTTRYGL